MAITASAANIAFASTVHGTTSAQTVTLTPDAGFEDSIFGLLITGANANQFQVSTSAPVVSTYEMTEQTTGCVTSALGAVTGSGGDDSSQVLGGGPGTGVGSTLTVTVTYAPLVAGSHAATLEIHYNGVGSPRSILIPLTGTAT